MFQPRLPLRGCVLFLVAIAVPLLLWGQDLQSEAHRDQDGDGLLDSWETRGFDATGDGVVDVDLPAMGANPRRKDVFLECDFMVHDLNSDGDGIDQGEHTHEPLSNAVQRVITAFANSPVSNPDGSTGITAHIDTGNLGGGNKLDHFFELDFEGRTHGNRQNPAVAMNATGNSLVLVWEDDRDGNGYLEVYYQSISNSGFLVGNERAVNSIGDGQQRRPAVAMDGNGNFVVVWEDDQDGNGYYQIMARGFNADGTQRFADITVNSEAAGQQRNPAIAMNTSGNFVVVWEDDQDGNAFYQIRARGFNANGTQRFADITVNSEAGGQQLKPAIAMDGTGQFVVTWEDDQDGNWYFQIQARGFNTNGTQRFADITVNSEAAGQQRNPSIAMDGSGRFVVTWEDDQDGNWYFQIQARGFNANGTQRFADITVNSLADGQQHKSAVAMDAAGNFVVVWEDDSDGNDFYQVLTRGFSSTGMQRFADTTVNTVAADDQLDPTIAVDSAGNSVIAWEDDRDSNSFSDVFMRGFTPLGGSLFAEFLGHGKGSNNNFATIKARNFEDTRRQIFHYCLFVHNRIFTGSSGVARPSGSDLIVSLGSFENQVGSVAKQANTLMHELGHNLSLEHGGSEETNNKPNYNSVMNYDYQFSGVDNDCDAQGNGILNYSLGTLPPLVETNLNEVAGMCNGFVPINLDSAGQQVDGVVAANSLGNFVVAWDDDQDGNDYHQIMARGFNANGTQRFAGVTVNSVAAGQQLKPAIAMDGNGNFVVVWEDDQDGNGYYQIMARGFNADGTQRFADITVNSEAAGQQRNPAIAMNTSGNFVVVWEDDQDGNAFYQIRARGFNANGTQRFADITVNSEAGGQQLKPAIAMDGTGQFVVTWEDDQDGNWYFQILARGFNADGRQRFADITVNSEAAGQQRNPSIAMDGTGRFVVTWKDDQDGNWYFQIQARGFNANGTQRFADITVNSVASGQQRKPRITLSVNGDFLVTWEDDQESDGYYQIAARSFTAAGAQIAPQFTVNIDGSGQQFLPRVASNGAGNVVLVWEDDADGNGKYEIYGRTVDFLGNALNTVSIDWNRNGSMQASTIFDINADDAQNELNDFDDWEHIKLNVLPTIVWLP